MSQSLHSPHNEELVPNLKEQFLHQLKQEVSAYTSQLCTGSSSVIRSSVNVGLIKRVSICACALCICVCMSMCVSVVGCGCAHGCVNPSRCYNSVVIVVNHFVLLLSKPGCSPSRASLAKIL